jgi:hypothetical protein
MRGFSLSQKKPGGKALLCSPVFHGSCFSMSIILNLKIAGFIFLLGSALASAYLFL